MLTTIVEGVPKDPFSTANTPNVGMGVTTFLGLLHFTLDPYFLILSVKQRGISTIFYMTLSGIEPRSPGTLVNPLTVRSMD